MFLHLILIRDLDVECFYKSIKDPFSISFMFCKLIYFCLTINYLSLHVSIKINRNEVSVSNFKLILIMHIQDYRELH